MQKNTIFIVTGVALGILAATLTHLYLKKEKAAIWENTEPVEVVVAVQDVSANTPLQSALFSTAKVPKKGLHPNAVYPQEINFDKLVGVRLNFPLKAGQPLLWTDFSSGGLIQRLSEIVKKGERALSIPVSVVTSVNNFVRPNDHVDIIGTFKIEYPPSRPDVPPPPATFTTLTMLQNVKVLAVGDQTEYTDRIGKSQAQEANYSAITVEVTAEEAQELVFAQQKGTLSLLLRNKEDVETLAKTPKTTVESLFRDEFREYLQEKRNRRVEIIKGGQ